MAQGKKARRAKGDPMRNEKPVIGADYLHEALHMADYFRRAVEAELGEHPAVKNNPEFAAVCEVARSALGDLYQKLGGAMAEAAKAEEKRMRDQFRNEQGETDG